MRSTPARLAAGAAAYLTIVAAAWVGALVDGRAFAGLLAVMLAWPWVDELPSAALPVGYLLNAAIAGLALNLAIVLFRRKGESHRRGRGVTRRSGISAGGWASIC